MSSKVVKMVEMEIHIDPHVKMVLEFMQANLPIRKCVEVANAVKELALPLWGRYVKPTDRYDQDIFVPIALKRPRILSTNDMLKQSGAIE